MYMNMYMDGCEYAHVHQRMHLRLHHRRLNSQAHSAIQLKHEYRTHPEIEANLGRCEIEIRRRSQATKYANEQLSGCCDVSKGLAWRRKKIWVGIICIYSGY